MNPNKNDRYYCKMAMRDVLPESRNHKSVTLIVTDLTSGTEIAKIPSRIEGGTCDFSTFNFGWSIQMSRWVLSLLIETGTETLYVKVNEPVQISQIVQDRVGGQIGSVNHKDDIISTTIEIRLSQTPLFYPSAYAYGNCSDISKVNMFERPTAIIQAFDEKTISASIAKSPFKLHVAIDLTSSNGNPRDSNSLHNMDQSKNQYLQIMRMLSDLIAFINTSEFPIYGFGYACEQQQSRCVPVGNFTKRYWPSGYVSQGSGAVIECYGKILEELIEDKSIRLSGPTNFKPVVEEVTKQSDRSDHNVLLLFTDGAECDPAQFNQHLSNVGPNINNFLSILLVVVGNDRDAMNTSRGFEKPFLQVYGPNDVRDGSFFGKVTDYLSKRSQEMSKQKMNQNTNQNTNQTTSVPSYGNTQTSTTSTTAVASVPQTVQSSAFGGRKKRGGFGNTNTNTTQVPNLTF